MDYLNQHTSVDQILHYYFDEVYFCGEILFVAIKNQQTRSNLKDLVTSHFNNGFFFS